MKGTYITLLFLLIINLVRGQDKYIVTKDIYLKSNPDKSADDIISIPKGTQINLGSRSDSPFIYTKFKEEEGYISLFDLELLKETETLIEENQSGGTQKGDTSKIKGPKKDSIVKTPQPVKVLTESNDKFSILYFILFILLTILTQLIIYFLRRNLLREYKSLSELKKDVELEHSGILEERKKVESSKNELIHENQLQIIQKQRIQDLKKENEDNNSRLNSERIRLDSIRKELENQDQKNKERDKELEKIKKELDEKEVALNKKKASLQSLKDEIEQKSGSLDDIKKKDSQFTEKAESYKPIVVRFHDKVFEPSANTLGIFDSKIISNLNAFVPPYTSFLLRKDVIKFGTCNFDEPFEGIKPYEKVQIYCYFNMRKHFFSSYAIYEALFPELENRIFGKNRKLFLIDIGCGPLTSGLGLAAVYYDKKVDKNIQMTYYGIDTSEAMRKKAKEFAGTSLLSSSKCNFHKKLNEIDLNKEIIDKKSQNLFFIINTSYLFASDSLEDAEIVSFISKLKSIFPAQPILFVFQNPDDVAKNKKYDRFKEKINILNTPFSEVRPIKYKNRPPLGDTSEEVVKFEILEL